MLVIQTTDWTRVFGLIAVLSLTVAFTLAFSAIMVVRESHREWGDKQLEKKVESLKNGVSCIAISVFCLISFITFACFAIVSSIQIK